MGKKIIVTGGAGFIGSHIVDAYIAAGHSVAIIDNLSTGSKANLNPKARFYEADILDAQELNRIFALEKPEVVNHQAAITSVLHSDVAKVNEEGTAAVLVAAAPYIKKFIFASSGGALNANPKKIPTTEDETPTPISEYGRSKLAGENFVKEAAKKYNFLYTILRPSNVYGPRQNSHGEGGIVAIFTHLALENKQPTIYQKDATRDYVYVSDVARANLLVLDDTRNETYNLATAIETPNQAVFEKVAAVFNWNQRPIYKNARPGEVFRSCLSPVKAADMLTWQPAVPFLKGITLIKSHLHDTHA